MQAPVWLVPACWGHWAIPVRPHFEVIFIIISSLLSIVGHAGQCCPVTCPVCSLGCASSMFRGAAPLEWGREPRVSDWVHVSPARTRDAQSGCGPGEWSWGVMQAVPQAVLTLSVPTAVSAPHFFLSLLLIYNTGVLCSVCPLASVCPNLCLHISPAPLHCSLCSARQRLPELNVSDLHRPQESP